MKVCNHCDRNYQMGRQSRNYIYEGFCSRLCYLMDEGGHAPGTKPDITVICEACAEPFNMIHQDNYNNSHFCSVSCSRIMRSLGRKAERHYHFLQALKYTGKWMSASQVAEFNKYRHFDSLGAGATSNVLKLWAARGIIEVDRTNPPVTYRWSSDLPTVAAMLNYKKVV